MTFIKEPKFFRTLGIINYILAPLSLLYFCIVSLWRLKFLFKKKRFCLGPRVICVGNVVLGGSGKTPVCIALTRLFSSNGKKCAFLTKGYGRKSKQNLFIHVGSGSDLNYKDVGDESILLSRYADVFVVSDRGKIPEAAREYDYIIADDGMFDQSIHYDKKLLVINGEYGIGNGMLFPSGPLRWLTSSIVNSISSVVMIGNDLHNIAKKFPSTTPTINARMVFTSKPVSGTKYCAFSGIAHNQRFFDTLCKNGYNVIKVIEFSDHYPYTDHDIECIIDLAASLDCEKIITTEKDHVKISKKYRNMIDVGCIEINFKNRKQVIECMRM